MQGDIEELKPLEFYTDEELLELKDSFKLAKSRTNKMMQISRLTHTINLLMDRMGFANEEAVKRAETRGEEFNYQSLYDAYVLAKYERKAARIKLGQMPIVPSIVQVVHLFFYEVQKEDPEFWVEMKERAGKRAAKINQAYKDSMETEQSEQEQ